VRYLRIDRGASVAGGAGAYAAGQLIAVFARLRLVPRSDANRVRPVAVAGGLLSAGLVLERAAPAAWLAGVGLAVAAAAAALVVPLLLARAGGRDRPGATLAAVGAAGQLGFVLGPALIGAATSVSGSGAGLLVAAALATVMAVGASRLLSVDAIGGVSDCVSAMNGRGASNRDGRARREKRQRRAAVEAETASGASARSRP
jgi:MFS family permease